MKTDSEVGALDPSDEERVGHVAEIVRDLAEMMESGVTNGLIAPSAQSAARLAACVINRDTRRQCCLKMHAPCRGQYSAWGQDRILEVNLSLLVTDLRSVVDNLQWQLHEALRAFELEEQRAA